MKNKIKITLRSIKVYDNGDPSHETHGEIFYTFKVNGQKVKRISRSKPIKLKDGETIAINEAIELEDITKMSPAIVISGYAGDVDKGLNRKDEYDTFKVNLTGRNKWKAGTNRIYVKDGRLSLKFTYEVTVTKTSNEPEIATLYTPIEPTQRASLTVVSFEDSRFYNLVQNAHNNYSLAFDGYNKSVLIKLVYNELKQPTKLVQDISTQSILNELKLLADEGYAIDLFIHSHGSCEKVTMKNGHEITPENIATLATGDYNNGRFPLRMVYQINCNGSTLNEHWINAGAKVVCGSRYTNYYPNQYNKFMREWNSGERFDRALRNSNTASSRTVMQQLIVLDAISQGRRCGNFKTVLGKNDCASSYHLQNWFYAPCDSYDENLKGKENMNIASTMIIAGDNDMRKIESGFSW